MSDKHLSTGVSLFNLQLTGNAKDGIKPGSYAFIVGDSSAGKSFLATTIAASAAIDHRFDDYTIYYDDVENGCAFNVEELFSDTIADRIKQPPHGTSTFIDDFYRNAKDAVSNGPCVYILDSQDALTTKEEAGKYDEMVKAVAKAGGDTEKALRNLSGQMADGKAKKHSQYLRRLVSMLEENGSILIILGQTRDDLTGYAKDSLVWSGGRALKFYCHIMLHMQVKSTIKKTVGGTKREIGIESRVKVVKNRQTGKRSEAVCPIYYSHGYDDVGAMIDWLVAEGVWSGGTTINTNGVLDEKPRMRETLIGLVDQSDDLYTALVDAVQAHWDDVEGKLKVARKNRWQ